jgi:hypothetical protein
MNSGLKTIMLGLSFLAATSIFTGCADHGLGKPPKVARNDETCGGQTQPKVEHSRKGESKINPIYKKAAKAQKAKYKKHKKSVKKQQGNPGFGEKKGFPWIF